MSNEVEAIKTTVILDAPNKRDARHLGGIIKTLIHNGQRNAKDAGKRADPSKIRIDVWMQVEGVEG